MNSDIIRKDATKLAELIRTKELSPVEVVKAHLERIEIMNPEINAVVTVAHDALKAAKAAEAAALAGETLGPLHGVPFTAKDSFDTAGVPTQLGSPIFKERIPATDAPTVARMKSAGAILLAKTNLPEFSFWIESDNLLSGRTLNPWNLERTPGGSSGGESAAIAAGLSPIGLATDIAISVRGPAALTGVVGLKPTHGRIPMTGIWPRVPRRFWHAGPMARTVRDVALGYSLLAGLDGADGFSTTLPALDTGVGAKPNRPIRVGWLVKPGFGAIDKDVASTVEAAAEALKGAGVIVEPVRIPVLEQINALDLLWKLQAMETKPAFKEVTAGHEDLIYKHVRAIFDTPDTSIKDFVEAEQQIEAMRDGFAAYFQRYDALLCPVTPVPAHAHDASEFNINGQSVSSLHVMDATAFLNVTGLPGLALRFGTSSEGLPVGVQLVSPWLAESTILHLGALLESVSPVRDLHPY
ncbi:Aspartyl-tRNA(Asn) amidotransferase subunit A Glutamyl-tRNA(Gln) amidotransferase subunit A [Candidatus Burkholderia verschuerenii]|uniref:Aspartyl-tRNA(Asn) amidotransferase subunit A Glutamyl-tRNA(Gln) amidotransferase subunit A n=2 Tax=Candidatus Burkholderia verschuerenii TaxID=242163 RepID=A0A0L0MHX5_9BURK|nr:amidase [Candidatus Burkholderia verschuerenii]KND61923.1 Aspartyl-tRNA(Asn) amidotransferase subunit A Glutamyl-tRNA(Gln) amidotransferase subunit A [Candidatus Burkholderia verschuerenii]